MIVVHLVLLPRGSQGVSAIQIVGESFRGKVGGAHLFEGSRRYRWARRMEMQCDVEHSLGCVVLTSMTSDLAFRLVVAIVISRLSALSHDALHSPSRMSTGASTFLAGVKRTNREGSKAVEIPSLAV